MQFMFAFIFSYLSNKDVAFGFGGIGTESGNTLEKAFDLRVRVVHLVEHWQVCTLARSCSRVGGVILHSLKPPLVLFSTLHALLTLRTQGTSGCTCTLAV